MSHNWKNTLISDSSTIKHALEIINNEGLHIALVINHEKKLLGVVTDGDIRRNLLKGLALTESVEQIMNKKPITAIKGTPKDELILTMRCNSILAIPLVEQNGQVAGLETVHSALNKKQYENPIFIMAGGFGTRLKPLTDNCPKPMLKIGDKPILETILHNFKNYGFSNFYISTHYMPEIIQNYFGDGSKLGVKIKYVHETAPLGTAGALGLLPKDQIGNLPIIVMNADLLTNLNFEMLLQFHMQKSADATVCVREYEYQIPYGVIEGNGRVITNIVEKPIQRYFVNAGIYVLSANIIESITENVRIDMPTLLDMHIKKNNILMFPIHEYWLDIGKIDDFNRAQSDIHELGAII